MIASRKWVSLLTCITLLLTLTCMTVVSATPAKKSLGEKETESNVTYNEMLDSFSEARLGRPLQDTQDLSNTNLYPDNYAGSYIDDNGQLVVLQTRESDTSTNRTALSNAAKSNGLQFSTATYSYRDLVASLNQITQAMRSKFDGVIQDVMGAGIWDRENCIKVYIQDITPQKVQQFQLEIANDPWLVFENVDGPLTTDAGTLKAGSNISVSGSGYSVGYRAKLGNATGFVTAAHGVVAIGKDVNGTNGTHIGTVTARRYSGSVDAAFVQITSGSGWTATNGIEYSGGKVLRSGVMMNPAQGTTVNKSGYMTYVTSGKVTSVNETRKTDDGVTLTNLTLAGYSATKGDSGGVVYSNDASPYLCGIHHGQAGGGQCAFIKATAIRDAMGISPY